MVLPADPPRRSLVAFWRADGTPPVTRLPSPAALTGPADELAPDQRPSPEVVSLDEISVALPDEDGTVGTYDVPALLLPLSEALPVLTRAGAARTGTAAEFWGAAALLALRLAAQGKLLPGLSPEGHDAWRIGPLDTGDSEALAELAAAMPPHAHAVPLPGPEPLRLPAPARQLRAFLDAVADTLPRTPAAPLAAGGPAFTDTPAHPMPELRAWADAVAAGHDAGVRLSLRIEVDGLSEDDGDAAPRFRGVLQLHSMTDASVVADAAEVWAGSSPVSGRFGPRVRTDALLTLRRAAGVWEALAPLLSAAVPDSLELADEEIAELLGPSVAPALAATGVQVHWPRELARQLTARAVIGTGGPEDEGRSAQGPGGDGSALPSLLSPEALLSFNWHFAIGDHEVSRAELEKLAEAGRPVVRLRDQWVLVAPDALRKARTRQDHKVGVLDALGSVLTGTSEQGGDHVDVRATGWLEELRARLAEPEPEGRTPMAQPAALQATLRDYQLRGLDWLHRMTSLGLGACLADDMGLGKTITLIALHLQRQELPATAGPALVICPTSLMGNWQREIERFAPGTPVRRFHGAARSLDGLADGEFVLTTYGTMRLDAERLGASAPDAPWGMVVADEAQHVKNPFSATAKALRTIPSRARVALTGTPVENNLSELWAILDWTTPSLLGRLGTFRRRYADAAEGGTDPVTTERLARLVRPFLLRRHKTDPGIAPELPPKTETDRAVSLTPEQAGLYEAVVRESLAELSGTEGFTRRGLVVRLLTSLKQICNHPAQYLKEDGTPRLPGRSGKLELLDELLDTILAEDASVLVFTQYVQMARLLERHLAARGVSTQCLHGGTPVAEREDMVRRFQEGKVPVFLLSLKAAGTGLNLTQAEHVIHFDRWWNPAVEAQATDRAYRIGQTRPVQVHRLITEGTIEDRIAGMLRRKQALADAVLGSGEGALTELSDAELAELVELRKDER